MSLTLKAVLITAAVSLYFYNFPAKKYTEDPVRLMLIPYNVMPYPKNRTDSILMEDETGKKYLLSFSGIIMDCEHYITPLRNLTNKLDPYYE